MKPQFAIPNEKFEQLKKRTNYLTHDYTFEVVDKGPFNTYFYCYVNEFGEDYTSIIIVNALVRNGAELHSWE